jgi:hypothetical protein
MMQISLLKQATVHQPATSGLKLLEDQWLPCLDLKSASLPPGQA